MSSKFGGKCWHQCGCGGRGGTPGRTIFTRWCVHAPFNKGWGGPCGSIVRGGIGGYHCKQEPVCPAECHPRCVAAGAWSLTQMNMASFMVLVMPWDSLSTMEKLSSLMKCPMVLAMVIGEGGSHYLASMVLSGMPPLPHIHIGTKFSCHVLAPIGKYNFFTQTWRSIVSTNITKACLCTNVNSVFVYWIVIIQQNEKHSL